MLIVRSIVVLFLTIFPTQCIASDLSLDLWGVSYHVNRDKHLNETNWGLGIDYKLEALSFDRVAVSAGAGMFKDSYYLLSKYAGLKAFYKVTDHFHVGTSTFLMSRPNHKNGNIFFSALPLIKLEYKGFAVNATYIPRVDAFGLNETYAMFVTVPLNF